MIWMSEESFLLSAQFTTELISPPSLTSAEFELRDGTDILAASNQISWAPRERVVLEAAHEPTVLEKGSHINFRVATAGSGALRDIALTLWIQKR